MIRKLLFFFISVLVFSCSQPEIKIPNVKHVIIIGVDGMSVGGVIESSTPNFDEFIKNGAHTFHTRNVMPTSSSPNWEAMLTGSGVALTGVTSNEWRFDNYNLPPVVLNENGRFPDIFYAIKRSNNSLKTASIYHWDGFANLYDHDFVDLDFDCEDEIKTTQKVSEIIQTEKPNFLFIQLDQVDHAGHEFGHMTEKYFESIELADSLAGIIVDATKKAGIFEETLFLIVADHGGVGFGHGHETLQGNEVPFILFGKAVKKGYEIPAAVNLYDVAATSAFALNIGIPQVWEGRPVECAFNGFPEPANLIGSFMAPTQNIPIISPRKINGEVGGLFVDGKAVVTLESEGRDGNIRYTTDGSIPNTNSEVYIQPFEMEHLGVIKAVWFGNNGSRSNFSTGYFRLISENEKPKVSYSIYKGTDWKQLPDFTKLKPVSEGKIYEISIDEIQEKTGQNTGVVFEPTININKEGEYTFATKSDDGSRLFIDGKLIVDNDGDHDTQEREGSVNLKAGNHKIRVEYFNGGGGAYLNCFYSGPGIPRQIISPDSFK